MVQCRLFIVNIMKNKNSEFIELKHIDWLKLQLRLKALEGRGTEWSFIFNFKDECKSDALNVR